MDQNAADGIIVGCPGGSVQSVCHGLVRQAWIVRAALGQPSCEGACSQLGPHPGVEV